MQLPEFRIKSKRSRKRVGRGIAAGGGKTAGRGTKGQKSRTGKKFSRFFEGGQTPLHMRLPKKRGFRHVKKRYFAIPNQIIKNLIDTKRNIRTISPQVLKREGIIPITGRVKIIGGGSPPKGIRFVGVTFSRSMVGSSQKEKHSYSKYASRGSS